MENSAVNKIPEHEIEALARCFLPDVIAFYETEAGKKEYADWERQELDANC